MSVQFMIAADLHYLSSELYDSKESFAKNIGYYDTKLTEYSEEILNALMNQAVLLKPDAVIFPGDLTFNGEMQSLKELKEKLHQLQENGIPVLVIPGNHDVNYNACSYQGSEKLPAENVSFTQFKEMMCCFGYNQALAKDSETFSYVYEVNGCRLLFMDANTEEGISILPERVKLFAEEQVKKAKMDGVNMITVSHQTLLPPFAQLPNAFTMIHSEGMADMLNENGVRLHLSGHAHLQSTTVHDSLSDIVTESLSVWPLQYGFLTMDDNGYHYENQRLGILEDEAGMRFEQACRAQMEPLTSSAGEYSDKMVRFATAIGKHAFTGTLNEETILKAAADKAWILWQKYGRNSFWKTYLESIIKNTK